MSVSWPVFLSVCLSFCQSACLSVSLPVCLSVSTITRGWCLGWFFFLDCWNISLTHWKVCLWWEGSRCLPLLKVLISENWPLLYLQEAFHIALAQITNPTPPDIFWSYLFSFKWHQTRISPIKIDILVLKKLRWYYATRTCLFSQ